ncbi:MAG: hypothetical protein R3A79_11545 [Nannocystaceae bacterium]
MTDAATVLARLRSDSALIDAGVDALLDDALERPICEHLAPTEALVGGLAAAIRATAQSPQLAPWIEVALADLRGQLPSDPRPLRERLPPALPGALAGALGRPFTPGRELVRAAINHAAMRSMMRSILQSTLLEFGKRMWSALPDTRRLPGAGFRSRLMDMAKGVASVVGSEVERQLDDRVNTYLDGALADAIDMVIERISDPRHAKEMAAWRADAIPALAAQPQVRFVAELDQIEAADVAADAVALLQAVAAWEELEAALTGALERLFAALGERSLAQLLEGSGLVEAWRPLVRERAAAHARAALTGERFAAWIARVVDGAATEGEPAA